MVTEDGGSVNDSAEDASASAVSRNSCEPEPEAKATCGEEEGRFVLNEIFSFPLSFHLLSVLGSDGGETARGRGPALPRSDNRKS